MACNRKFLLERYPLTHNPLEQTIDGFILNLNIAQLVYRWVTLAHSLCRSSRLQLTRYIQIPCTNYIAIASIFETRTCLIRITPELPHLNHKLPNRMAAQLHYCCTRYLQTRVRHETKQKCM